jgi:NAD(P)-dependent dehydrogenase (short-subunit alcohol dehydrogenase family)
VSCSADVEQDALDDAAHAVAKIAAVGDRRSGRTCRRPPTSRRSPAPPSARSAACRSSATTRASRCPGLSWQHTLADWEWVLGVNLWGVIHGIRTFVPRLLAAKDEAHVVNTGSIAGLLSGPGMAVYGASKHGVVTISESLYYELRMLRAPIGVSVLCPAAVATSIMDAERNRPAGLTAARRPAPMRPARDAAKARLAAGMRPERVAGVRRRRDPHEPLLGALASRVEGVRPHRLEDVSRTATRRPRRSKGSSTRGRRRHDQARLLPPPSCRSSRARSSSATGSSGTRRSSARTPRR